MGTTFMEGRLGNLDSQSEVYVPNYWWGANLRNLEIMFSVLRKKLLCLLIAGRSATTRTVDDDDDAAARARARGRRARRRPAPRARGGGIGRRRREGPRNAAQQQ
jgi:hypothetical protein